MMRKFVFITAEGEAMAPTGEAVKNMQVIGIIDNVINEDEALKKLLRENSWIFDLQFNVAEFVTYEIL